MSLIAKVIATIVKAILSVVGFVAWFIAFVIGCLLGLGADLLWWALELSKPARELVGLPGIVNDHGPTDGPLPITSWVAEGVTSTWRRFNRWLWGEDE